MDKELDELRDDIRRTLQAIHDNVLELNDYLVQLRAHTVADMTDEAILRRNALTQVPAGVFVPTTEEPTPDPRFPYLAGRQPRRDGDSFGSVPSSQTGGDTHGSKAAFERQRRRTAREEKT